MTDAAHNPPTHALVDEFSGGWELILEQDFRRLSDKTREKLQHAAVAYLDSLLKDMG